ncbi:TPA: lysostaphin resistance A-like protein [Raoultella planticola]
MESVKYGEEFIARSKAVSGCFAMFILAMAITFFPLFIKNGADLMARGLLIPLLLATEFVIIVPLYYFFFRKREGLGRGSVDVKTLLSLFVIILLLQCIFPWLTGMSKPEGWSVSQVALPGYLFWLNAIAMVVLAPVYEEIVFRGCLFNAFCFWFNDRVYGAAIAVSVLFSLMHLQYSDFRTFLLLFMISLTLVAARVKSKGLLMPILLHGAMNAIVLGIQYSAWLPDSAG